MKGLVWAFGFGYMGYGRLWVDWCIWMAFGFGFAWFVRLGLNLEEGMDWVGLGGNDYDSPFLLRLEQRGREAGIQMCIGISGCI